MKPNFRTLTLSTSATRFSAIWVSGAHNLEMHQGTLYEAHDESLPTMYFIARLKDPERNAMHDPILTVGHNTDRSRGDSHKTRH
jgi:hypothetical protein